MSLSSIIKDVTTWAGKIETTLKKFFGSAVTWETIAESTLEFIGIAAPLVLDVIDPALAPVIWDWISRLQMGLAVAINASRELGTTTSLKTFIEAILSETQAIISQYKITGGAATMITKIATELETLLDAFPAPKQVPAEKTVPQGENVLQKEKPENESPAPPAPKQVPAEKTEPQGENVLLQKEKPENESPAPTNDPPRGAFQLI